MKHTTERSESTTQDGVTGLSWNEVFAIMRQYLHETSDRHSGRADLMMDRRAEPNPVPWKEPDPSPWRSAALSLLITGIALDEVLARLPKSDFATDLRSALEAVMPNPEDMPPGPRHPGGPVEMAMEIGLFAQSLANGALRDRMSAVAGQLLRHKLGNRIETF